jgi:undecaprenyl-diphosphatase
MTDLSAVGQGRRYEDYQDLSSDSDGQSVFPRAIPYTDADAATRHVSSLSVSSRTASPPEHRATHWLIAGLGLLLAAIVLTLVAAGEGIVPGDVAIARAIQQPPSSLLDVAARVVSDIGDEFPAMAIMALGGVALLVLRGRRELALLLALAAALRALGPMLKVLINSPRPTMDAVVVVAQADGLGFPSGHALGAALFYGAIAIIVPQVVKHRPLARVLQIIAVIAMLLIAWSRVRLGVHWPSDVAGGLLFGLSLVCLLRAAFLFLQARFKT